MPCNVRRYVALAQSRGGAPCPAPNVVKVGVFLHSWCDAGLCGYYFILALAKTPDKSGQAVTPRGSPRREPGRPAPPLKVFHADQNILAVQKPIAYTDLLALVVFIYRIPSWGFPVNHGMSFYHYTHNLIGIIHNFISLGYIPVDIQCLNFLLLKL